MDNQHEFCVTEFSRINAKLDRMDEAIRGNGKPGIVQRVDRLEQVAKVQSRLVWLVVGSFVTGGVMILISRMAA